MDPIDDEPTDPANRARQRGSPALAAIASRLGIEGAFARPNDLARLIGMSSSAIRSMARKGAFPIPHRRIGTAILFKMEDVAAWHDRPCEEPPKPSQAVAASRAVGALADRERPRAKSRPSKRGALAQIDKETAARIKAKVLAEMALERR